MGTILPETIDLTPGIYRVITEIGLFPRNIQNLFLSEKKVNRNRIKEVESNTEKLALVAVTIEAINPRKTNQARQIAIAVAPHTML